MANFDIPEGEQQNAARITLGLLNAVDVDRTITQRRIAADLGIAVGLVNAYVKRCVNKGLIKVQQAPKRRYAYYLTPKGFAEKSRLTVAYLFSSFDFFRRARASCETALGAAGARGWRSMVVVGRSDLAEIAFLCALHHPLRIVALVDKDAGDRDATFASVPVFAQLGAVTEPFDGVLIADVADPQAAHDFAVVELGATRVLVPDLLAQAIVAASPVGGDA